MRKLSRTALVKKLDRIFSRHIRNRYAVRGWCACVTCGKQVPVEDAHAGHFVRRQHMAVRWNEKNVHPQCVRCNTFLDGNEGEYARFILDTYGRATLDELLAAKNQVRKWTSAELLELIDHYSGVRPCETQTLSGR